MGDGKEARAAKQRTELALDGGRAQPRLHTFRDVRQYRLQRSASGRPATVFLCLSAQSEVAVTSVRVYFLL